jgi:hypothetical protein
MTIKASVRGRESPQIAGSVDVHARALGFFVARLRVWELPGGAGEPQSRCGFCLARALLLGWRPKRYGLSQEAAAMMLGASWHGALVLSPLGLMAGSCAASTAEHEPTSARLAHME